MKTLQGVAGFIVISMLLSVSGCAVLQIQSRLENGLWREYPGAEIERLNWVTGSSKIRPQGSKEQRQVLLDFSGTIIDEACSQDCGPMPAHPVRPKGVPATEAPSQGGKY